MVQNGEHLIPAVPPRVVTLLNRIIKMILLVDLIKVGGKSPPLTFTPLGASLKRSLLRRREFAELLRRDRLDGDLLIITEWMFSRRDFRLSTGVRGEGWLFRVLFKGRNFIRGAAECGSSKPGMRAPFDFDPERIFRVSPAGNVHDVKRSTRALTGFFARSRVHSLTLFYFFFLLVLWL